MLMMLHSHHVGGVYEKNIFLSSIFFTFLYILSFLYIFQSDRTCVVVTISISSSVIFSCRAC